MVRVVSELSSSSNPSRKIPCCEVTLSCRALRRGVSDSARSRSIAQGAAESVAPMNWALAELERSESDRCGVVSATLKQSESDRCAGAEEQRSRN